MAEKVKKQANPAVIQAVKAIAVLVIICLICGLLLALCNDLLYVSDEDKFNRAMAKIYDGYGNGDTQFNSTYKLETALASSTTGKINSIKKAEGKDVYIFDVQGYGGYKGAITLYVVVGPLESGDNGIIAWTIKEHNGETLLSNINTNWYVNKPIKDYPFSVDNHKATGATMSSSAINNAINLACSYGINSDLKLATNDLSEAQTAALALLETNGHTYSSLANFSGQSVVGTALNGANDTLSYILIGAGDNTAYVYVYGEGEDRKIVAVISGTNEVITSDNCDESADFYQKILSKPIREIAIENSQQNTTYKLYTFVSDSDTEGTEAVYTVVGFAGTGYTPRNYTLTITLQKNGDTNKSSVKSIEIALSGFEPDGPDPDDAHALKTGLEGATLDNIDSVYSDGFKTEATQSANIITAAVKAALTDYDARLSQNA